MASVRSHVEPPDSSVTGVRWTRRERTCHCLSTGYFKVIYKQHGSLGSFIRQLIPHYYLLIPVYQHERTGRGQAGERERQAHSHVTVESGSQAICSSAG